MTPERWEQIKEIFQIVMEYIEGRSLKAELEERGRLAPAEALTMLEPIADALNAAHEAGVIHRDLKPDNIMIGKQAEGGALMKLLDLGLAKIVCAPGSSRNGSSTLTVAGRILGTPHYMAPEQWDSDAEIDSRADIYSLGVIFYELVAGRKPFSGKAAIELLRDQALTVPTPLHEIVPDLPKAFGRAIARATAKNRIQRQRTCKELIGELRASLLQTSDSSSAEPQRDIVKPTTMAHQRLLAAIALLLLFAVIAFAAVRFAKRDSSPAAASAADSAVPAATVGDAQSPPKKNEEDFWTPARDAFEGAEIPAGHWKGSGRASVTDLSENFSKTVWRADFDLWFTLDENGNAVGEVDIAYSAEMLIEGVVENGANPVLLKPQPTGDYPPRRSFPIVGVIANGELTIDIAVEERRPVELTLRADANAAGGKLILKKIGRAPFSPFAGAALLKKSADGSFSAKCESASERNAVVWNAAQSSEKKRQPKPTCEIEDALLRLRKRISE